MSKKTRLPENGIARTIEKINRLKEKLKGDLTPTARRNAIINIARRKSTLRHLCKLYVWGVK